MAAPRGDKPAGRYAFLWLTHWAPSGLSFSAMSSVTMSAPIVRNPAARRFCLPELAFIVPWDTAGGKRTRLLILARGPERYSARRESWGSLQG